MGIDLVEEARKRHLIGIHSAIGTPTMMESFGLVGLDFVIIGMEMEPVGRLQLRDLLIACQGAGGTPVVKVRRSTPTELEDALIEDAPYVCLPHITTRKELDQFVKISRYRPEGERMVCPAGRPFGYGSMTIQEAVAKENRSPLIPIIEDVEALDNLDEIFSAPIDIFEVGPFDLSVSMGAPSSAPYSDPKIVDALRKIGDAARKHDKLLLGPYWHAPEDEGADAAAENQARLADLGFRLFYLLSEFQLIRWSVRRGRRAMAALDAR